MADGALLRELNRDVWYPFLESYAGGDAKALAALFSPDLIHASGPAREVTGFEQYTGQVEQWFAELAEQGDRAEIDFRFRERIAAGDLASEQGFFRIVVRSGGTEQLIYGRFHTFCRKRDGQWRILTDYDSNDGGTITADMFTGATDMDDVAAFAG